MTHYSLWEMLQVGSQSGGNPYIHFNAHFSFTRGGVIELRSTWQLPESDSPAVTHLAWSPWVDSSPSQDSHRVSIFILAASRNDGSVHLSKVILRNPEPDGIDVRGVQTDTSRELLPRNRLSVTKFAWTRRHDDLILAVCLNGFLVLSIHPIKTAHTLSSAMAMCRHANYTPVVGNFLSCHSSLRINHVAV
jgi:hypothetical protein